MLVKCKICGNKIERTEAYKVVVNNTNHYYCNKAEYDTWLFKKKSKDDTYNLIYDIFERKITNTILFKEIGELASIYTYEKILAYLQEHETYLQGVMKKGYSSEYAQIRYFTAILKNSLTDFQYQKDLEPQKLFVDIPDNKFNRTKRRVPLIEYEERVGDEE